MSYRLKLIAAFFGIYVIWGSTYLAILFTIETMPPLLTSGVRFLISGVMLYAFMRYVKKEARPAWVHWRWACIVGAFLILGGNGNVVLAEQFVPSGLTALFLATMPIWVIVLDWLWLGSKRPGLVKWIGIMLGFIGVAILMAPNFLNTFNVHFHPVAMIGLIAAPLMWAIGSLFSRKAVLPSSALMGTSLQMICGGVLLLIVGAVHGEVGMIQPQLFSSKSVMALVYLIFFGTLWGYVGYVWLLKNVGPLQASTCAFVNPMVAVFLGWLLAGEHLNPQTALAAIFIIVAVMIITLDKRSQRII